MSNVRLGKLGKWVSTFVMKWLFQSNYPFHRVIAQVDGKMVKPPPERPLEGMITIHSEISPMASTDYEPGRYVIRTGRSPFKT